MTPREIENQNENASNFFSEPVTVEDIAHELDVSVNMVERALNLLRRLRLVTMIDGERWTTTPLGKKILRR